MSDSRATEDGSAIRRRRLCPACERKFTTVEQIVLTVVKRSGVVEAFSREKVIRGVSKACKGRPVTPAQLILSKLISSMVWLLCSILVIALSLGVFFLCGMLNVNGIFSDWAGVVRDFRQLADILQRVLNVSGFMLLLTAIGGVLFFASLARFRKTISQMA